MKKTLLLTLAAGVVCTTQVKAVDLYITGSTAFRANVHDACAKLFDNPIVTSGGNTSVYREGTAATGGDSTTGSKAAQWVMTGTVSNKVTALGMTPLTIHGLFTGSVQGIKNVENGDLLTFLNVDGTTNNTPATIAFSDVASGSAPYDVANTTAFNEESVAVQPFVMCRSVAQNAMTNITSITWEQLKYGIQAGRIPLAAWTYKASDLTNYVNLLERTQDSGTRRTELAVTLDGYNQSMNIYNWDPTNNIFYKATNTLQTTGGSVGYGVVGAPGNYVSGGYANLQWGAGYVGGSDIKTALNYGNSNNLSIAILSIADAKGVTGVNWGQVIAFDGVWPTAAGSGIWNNSGTNDFSPIALGSYALWANEVVVYPQTEPFNGSTGLGVATLGNQGTPGTILGVLDAVTTGTPVTGSIENEIVTSQPGGATAVRLHDMKSSRQSVGGTITP
jgi:hypothetical protein